MIFLSFVLFTSVLVLCLAGLTFAFYAFLRPVERSLLAETDLPHVSVIVPARNEEEKIGRCLGSLLKQDYPCYEIVVIDDRSTDKTGQILDQMSRRHKNVKLVQGKDLPEGWVGKCNALAHGAASAAGQWLVFTDADTCHKPNSLRDAVSYALVNQADLVSFIPVQELASFWERLVMPVLLGSFLCGDPFHTVNKPNNNRAYAYGQYVLVRASVYQAVGGHQGIRDEIVEDHALGRVVKTRGFRIAVGDGLRLYRVRMYTGLDSLWQGWTKNLYCLIGSRLLNLLAVIFLINAVTVLPFIQLAMVVSNWAAGNSSFILAKTSVLVVFELCLLFAWWHRTLEHYRGLSLYHFWLVPLGGLAVTALYLHSAYLVLSGSEITWKGRRYRVGVTKTIETSVARPLDPALNKVMVGKPRDY